MIKGKCEFVVCFPYQRCGCYPWLLGSEEIKIKELLAMLHSPGGPQQGMTIVSEPTETAGIQDSREIVCAAGRCSFAFQHWRL